MFTPYSISYICAVGFFALLSLALLTQEGSLYYIFIFLQNIQFRFNCIGVILHTANRNMKLNSGKSTNCIFPFIFFKLIFFSCYCSESMFHCQNENGGGKRVVHGAQTIFFILFRSNENILSFFNIRYWVDYAFYA